MTDSTSPDAATPAPVAERRAHVREVHGTTVEDPWFWLRDREDPAVIAHLEAENAHTEASLAGLGELRDQLFDEMKARTQETDQSVPVRKGDWEYEVQTTEGEQYARHVRRPIPQDPDAASPGATPDQVVLDENAEAGDADYFGVGDLAVSPNQELVAWTCDRSGDEQYTLEVRNIADGHVLDPAPGSDPVADMSYGFAWANDDTTVFYVVTDDAQRPDRVMRHEIGSNPSADVCVFEEPDERFWVGIGTTRSERFVVIGVESKTTSEYWVIDADAPHDEPRCLAPRREGVEYRISHHGDVFFVLTNDGALDFALKSMPVDGTGPAAWMDVIPGVDGERIEDIDVFADHVVLTKRVDAVPRLEVIGFTSDGQLDVDGPSHHTIDMPEAVCEVGPGANPDFHGTTFRYGYTSMVTPGSVYDYDIASRTSTLRKRQPVLGDFDPAQYETRRLWATAADGARVPISVVWRRGRIDPISTPAPCLLYGYGSYEIVMPATFSTFRLSLLDRGVVFAIAHVRGGGELGRRWYEEGRLGAKPNTFSDFIACAEHLVDEGWADPERIVARGGSAGGLLMGVIANERPDLWAGIVAEVPFVDTINTMLDPTIPLTVTEYDEWGNPNEPEAFDVMNSYSPYENIAELDYPTMLVTAGLNDPRVQYWEPAKWVQKLRTHQVGDAPILLRTEMGAGHGGPSGRYDAWRDEAFTVAFALDALGLSSS